MEDLGIKEGGTVAFDKFVKVFTVYSRRRAVTLRRLVAPAVSPARCAEETVHTQGHSKTSTKVLSPIIPASKLSPKSSAKKHSLHSESSDIISDVIPMDLGSTPESPQAVNTYLSLKNQDSWAAPELMASSSGGVYQTSYEADVFAMGVVMSEMFTMKRPWAHFRESIHVVSLYKATVAAAVARGKRPKHLEPKGNAPPPGFEAMIRKCWRQSPKSRPSAQTLLTRLKRVQALSVQIET